MNEAIGATTTVRSIGGIDLCLPSGHRVLLSSNSGICKRLADSCWSERDGQAHHRAHLEKATARSVVWFFHRVLLSLVFSSSDGGVFPPQDSGAVPRPSEMRW